MKYSVFFFFLLFILGCSTSQKVYEPINTVRWNRVVSGAGGGQGYQFYAYFFEEDLDAMVFIVNDVFLSVKTIDSGDTTIVSGYYFKSEVPDGEFPPKMQVELSPPFTKAVVNGYQGENPFSWETIKFVEIKYPPAL